ncbi:MAG: D-alanyl-D-alanine carboxypeptidase family protein [Acidobacteria bacterium]|nr:D-alanyl-D-alanine carboxypeptidase family protein [Acidobacteriota bacterium]
MRLRSLSFIAAVLAILLVLGPTVAYADYVPAGFAAYSEDLESQGYVNGNMDPDRLMRSHGCVLERDAAYTFALMMEAAEDDGVRLRIEDCYRSFNRQRSAWERRCPYTAVPARVIDPVTGENVWGTTTVRKCSGPPTARAGYSNHGWGRAIDFTDGWGVLTCRDTEFHWLQANAFRFGWVHPPWAHCGLRTEEAWHWEWAGVVDENLVPDYTFIWILDELTMARMMADLEEPMPLPALGSGDSEFLDRWQSVLPWDESAKPDQ